MTISHVPNFVMPGVSICHLFQLGRCVGYRWQEKWFSIHEVPVGGGIDTMDRWVLGIFATELLADFQNYLCLLQLFSKSLLTINRPHVPLKKSCGIHFILFHRTGTACWLDKKEVSPVVSCFLLSIYKVIGSFIVMISLCMFSVITFKVCWVETLFSFQGSSFGVVVYYISHTHALFKIY